MPCVVAPSALPITMASDGLPEPEAEEGDGDDADEDGRELEVRGGPGGEQLPRRAVALGGRDSFDAARFDRGRAGTGGFNYGHGESL